MTYWFCPLTLMRFLLKTICVSLTMERRGKKRCWKRRGERQAKEDGREGRKGDTKEEEERKVGLEERETINKEEKTEKNRSAERKGKRRQERKGDDTKEGKRATGAGYKQVKNNFMYCFEQQRLCWSPRDLSPGSTLAHVPRLHESS